MRPTSSLLHFRNLCKVGPTGTSVRARELHALNEQATPKTTRPRGKFKKHEFARFLMEKEAARMAMPTGTSAAWRGTPAELDGAQAIRPDTQMELLTAVADAACWRRLAMMARRFAGGRAAIFWNRAQPTS